MNVMNRDTDPDGFNRAQMRWAFEHETGGTDAQWQAAQAVAWAEIATRLSEERMHEAMALVSAWAQQDPALVKRVKAGIRRHRKGQA